MASNNDYFTPERVDEQIEQLRQASGPDGATGEAQLAHILQRHYHIPLEAADRAALERARQRMAGQQSAVDILEDDVPAGTIHHTSAVARSRGARFTRVLSGLAAVILVGALIGGWLAVTHLAGTSPTITPGRPSDLYVIHNDIVYRLDGRTGNVIWQRPLTTRKQPDPRVGSSAYLQVVHSVVYAVLDFDIYALDASTGKQIWHVVNHTSKSYFWFVVDNGRLYLYSLDSTFSALKTAGGTALWHNTAFKTENGYGFSVRDGNLYTENTDANRLYALDSATGKIRWSAPLPQGSLLGAPIVENGVVYVSSGNRLYALNEQSGERIWEQTIPGAGSLTDVSLAGGILYADSGSTIMEASTDTRNIFALNAQTGQLLWAGGPGYNKLNLPITDGLLLAAREHNGIYSLAGLDARTGRVAWQAPFQCAVYHFTPQLAYPSCSALWTQVINGKLYLLESDGQPQNRATCILKSFDPRTGQLVSAYQVAVEQNTVTAIGASGGILYLRIDVPRTANTIPYDDFLYAAYRLRDGALSWSHAMPPFPAPTSADTSPGTSQPVLAP